ncbi:PQQ-dependent sugar dehydrogenase [Nonomuraea sp. NPDC050536]|uniref:PQQ-dependent sugar dehydrogenase n=1 Tax=Nonomuraea sp. NPDC050536 TaxID=3364366 RepID=UPI0037C61FD2
MATDLTVPWGIAFLRGGDALVTERNSARLLRITRAGQVSEVGTIEGVNASGEGGLLGVAARGNMVFVYYTAADDNRIVRYDLSSGRLTNPKVLVTGIPKGSQHDGGRLAFGPDGYLYAGTGDAGDSSLAQRLDSLGGKILRMTVDGAPAPRNPFGTLVYSYGHRNVQGLAWDWAGRMYATEFGQNTWDEINAIKSGGNYGWPVVEGKSNDPRFINPIVTWTPAEASPSGLAFAKGSLWVGALRGERLWQVPLRWNGTPGTPIAHYTGVYGRLRAVATTPGRDLWVSTSNKDGRGTPRTGDDKILNVKL